MTDRYSELKDFLEGHGNDDSHSVFTTDLSLQLFDNLKGLLGLSEEERLILEDAALLHDAGTAIDPDNHVSAGAELLLKHDVPGLKTKRKNQVVAVILHHASKSDGKEVPACVAGVMNDLHVLRCAMILRIADGLDHCRLQDCFLKKVECSGDTVTLFLSKCYYPAGVQHALNKADYWKKVCDRRLSILSDSPRGKLDSFVGFLEPGDNALSAAGKLLFRQFRQATDQILPVLMDDDDPEPLHEMRVAIRRFRELLRIFRPLIGSQRCDALRKEASEFCDLLGPFRDADVWCAFIKSQLPLLSEAGKREAEKYLAEQEVLRKTSRRMLREILESAALKSFTADVSLFLKVELPVLRRESDGASILPFAVKRFCKYYRRVVGLKQRSNEMEKLHEQRKIVRRARYCAEFFSGVIGEDMEKAVLRLKALSDSLGMVHDIHAALVRLEKSPDCPEELISILCERREDCLRIVDKDWKKAFKKHFRKSLLNRVESVMG